MEVLCANMELHLELDQDIAIIAGFGERLKNFPCDVKTHQALLTEFGIVVQRSSKDERYRHKLASSKKVWKTLRDSVSDIDECNIKDAEAQYFYVRSIRALILLMRNLAVDNQEIPQVLLLQNVVVRSVLLQLCPKGSEITTSLYKVSLEFLHNLTKKSVTFDENEMESLMSFLKYPMGRADFTKETLLPYTMLFLNLTTCDEFLYYFVRHSKCYDILCNLLIEEITRKDSNLFSYLKNDDGPDRESQIMTIDAVLLQLFANLAANESFGYLIVTIEATKTVQYFDLLRLVELAIVSKESWSNAHLTLILSWCFPLFEETAKSVGSYFDENQEDTRKAQILHDKLSISLDIIVSLCHFEHTQEYLLSYNALEELIDLLQILQNNLIRINIHKNTNGSIKSLQATNSLGEKVSNQPLLSIRFEVASQKIMPTNFPECKSLIIEALSMLTHGRPSIQDKIRELHGLELILSNCIIDDNDPFIKERSILCLKFILANNQKNQEFVAKLEARKPVQDDVISEAGYEIKIGDNGNVSLKQKSNSV